MNSKKMIEFVVKISLVSAPNKKVPTIKLRVAYQGLKFTRDISRKFA